MSRELVRGGRERQGEAPVAGAHRVRPSRQVRPVHQGRWRHLLRHPYARAPVGKRTFGLPEEIPIDEENMEVGGGWVVGSNREEVEFKILKTPLLPKHLLSPLTCPATHSITDLSCLQQDNSRPRPRMPAVLEPGGCPASANCLTLDVYKPSADPPAGQLYPVFVFLHGRLPHPGVVH